MKITWADTERGRRTDRYGYPYGETNYMQKYAHGPPVRTLEKRGDQTRICIINRLTADGWRKAFGALTIYSKEPDPFSEDEVKLLAELANDLSYSITAIRWREALRKSEERFHAIAAKHRITS